jgi:hypothetical protein
MKQSPHFSLGLGEIFTDVQTVSKQLLIMNSIIVKSCFQQNSILSFLFLPPVTSLLKQNQRKGVAELDCLFPYLTMAFQVRGELCIRDSI